MCVEGQIFCLQASFWGGVWYHVTGGVLLLFVCVCVMCVGGWKDFPPNLSECLVCCMQEIFSLSFFLDDSVCDTRQVGRRGVLLLFVCYVWGDGWIFLQIYQLSVCVCKNFFLQVLFLAVLCVIQDRSGQHNNQPEKQNSLSFFFGREIYVR